MADMMNWEEYQELLKENISIMVTSPDPQDGHTHIAYVDKNGNGMTSEYPEYEEYSHQHMIIKKSVAPCVKGWSLSFHLNLQEVAEADLKEKKTVFSESKDNESQAFKDVFNDSFEGDDKNV